MRKSILIMVLAVVSSGAAAEWVKIGSGANFTVYADPATIRRKGDMVKMWSLLDYERPQVFADKPYRSLREQDEYDCGEERTRILTATFHSGNMADGGVASSNFDSDKWRPVAPGSADEVAWKFACGKQ